MAHQGFRSWGRIAAVLAGCLIPLGHASAQFSGPPPPDPYWDYAYLAVPSPLEALLAEKQVVPDLAAHYRLAVEPRVKANPSTLVLDWVKLVNYASVIEDGVLLNWEDDAHLTIASPSGVEMPTGPDQLGGVPVSYSHYKPGVPDGQEANATVVTLTDVTYSALRLGPQERLGGLVVCFLHAEGWDGAGHRQITSDIMAPFSRQSPDPVPSLALPPILFHGVTYLPGAAPRPTLTQAAVKGVPYFLLDKPYRSPAQASVAVVTPDGSAQPKPGPLIRQMVYYERAFFEPEMSQVFDLMREARYATVLEFGLGRQIVTFRFDAPIPHAVAEQYQACEAAAAPTSQLGLRLTLAPQ